jgi:hypothetical protein
MNFAYLRLQILAFIVVMIAATGCGQNNSGPQTVPVTGKVTLDGDPIAHAVVSLTPVSDATGGVPAQATTNESGEFEVYSAFDQGRTTQTGMVPGDYAVTVTKLESIPAQAQLTRAPKNLLPKQYESAGSSGLKATITADGDNIIVVDLKK